VKGKLEKKEQGAGPCPRLPARDAGILWNSSTGGSLSGRTAEDEHREKLRCEASSESVGKLLHSATNSLLSHWELGRDEGGGRRKGVSFSRGRRGARELTEGTMGQEVWSTSVGGKNGGETARMRIRAGLFTLSQSLTLSDLARQESAGENLKDEKEGYGKSAAKVARRGVRRGSLTCRRARLLETEKLSDARARDRKKEKKF